MRITFKRKAFTLIELLIVIAIIGILFIVLVSKVDFATDKAKTTGVQTDFRSFQVAFEQVSRENAGFNTLGWDTGDIKRTDFNTAFPGYSYNNELVDAGDGVRNSYDVGDKNFNGEIDENETWTGRKVYTETWTGIYTLTNPLNENDTSAYLKLEEAINKNLDPKLHITINPDTKEITMSNGYQDPWKTEYHGFYLSNAAVDGKDRGAILMYSDGPNKQFGSAQVIANGVVTIGVPQNNIQGQDDLSILTIYTYFNGYGENKTTTSGFSQNQNFLAGGNNPDMNVVPEGPGNQVGTGLPAIGTSAEDCTWDEIKAISEAGKGNEYFNLGDTKTITTTDGITVVMEIIAFDTDIKADGTGTAGITWLSKGIIDTRAFNQSNSITNGWKASELRTWLQGEFYGKLSSDVTSAIVSVNKGYYNHTTKLTEICVDNVWIPSVGEMCGYGVDSFGCEDSGVEYTTYFNDRTIRTKYDANGDSVMWWLRSAGNTNGYGRAVNSTGGFNAGSKPNEILGVTLGFCT